MKAGGTRRSRWFGSFRAGYTYITDTAPGQARGQALNLNGGLWYVLDPSGKVIKTKR